MDFQNVKIFMDNMALDRTPGNAVEIYVDNKRVFSYQSGYSDLEKRIPLDGSESYYIYSCSKITTVTAALQLLEQGYFAVTDPLYEYIPEYRYMSVRETDGSLREAKQAITIGDLFSMTAGLTYDMRTEAFQRAENITGGKMNTETVVRCIASDPLSFEPGLYWQYSLCHDVLAGLVEIISGTKFRHYVRENIFSPLSMEASRYHVTEAEVSGIAQQYCFVPEGENGSFDIVEAQKYGKAKNGTFVNCGKKNEHILGEEYDSGGAGIITTVSDYAKLMAALANHGTGVNGSRILSPGAVELMRTPRLTWKQRKNFNWMQLAGYNYGFGVRTLTDKAISGSNGSVGEFGWGGAAGANAFADPSRKLAVFYVQHCLNPREEYYQPRLRNVIYSCLD